jgi:hypothetical protein
MSTQCQWFKTFEPHIVPICVANNAIVYSKGIGLIVMEPVNESLDPVCLSRVLYVPVLQNNLFAVLHLVTSHCFCIVIKGTVMEFLCNGVRILTATIRDKTTWLNMRTVNALESTLRGETIHNSLLWHRHLGHIGKDLLEKVIKASLRPGCTSTAMHCFSFTVGCVSLGNTTPIPFLQRCPTVLHAVRLTSDLCKNSKDQTGSISKS